MKAEVERFYKEEFEPALMKKSSLSAPEGSLLPSSNAGLYLHYHYMANAPKPYGMKRLNQSAADHSAYAKAVAKYLPELEAEVGRLGLENITLVDPETMEVFFTIEQSTAADRPVFRDQQANLDGIAKSQNEGDYKVSSASATKAFMGTPRTSGYCSHDPGIPNTDCSILSGNESWAEEGLGKGEVYPGSRPDDAHRFPISYRKSGRIHSIDAAIDADQRQCRQDRETWHHHPHRSRETRSRRCGTSRRNRIDTAQ
jgi:hypothetical protein